MNKSNSVLHPDLSGRVALVTGASRGIGKALALRLAQEGADLVIAAKSVESTEKLPGSIHETAAAVRALDILVNNAGAIWLKPVLETPPKRFDLMMNVNVRAAYAAAYYALPHMRNQRWGHILNMCPALSLRATPGKVAYMISKLGMARVAIGIAEEHRADNIAANTLWPRTPIESQATINLGISARRNWRTPEIVCDASMAIFAQTPPSYTGHQLIDETVLRELAGVTDFDRYWCEGKAPADPYYIDTW
jgi:citronellol/citronellal dehydrogenase